MKATWRVLEGDAGDVLRGLPEGSVQTVVTSPPYYGLRDYDVPGQIGLEATPDEYVAALVAVFREVRRVLRDDGTVWLNLGDSYMARQFGWNNADDRSWAAYHREAGDERPQAKRSGHPMEGSHAMSKATGIKPKDLIGIPWLVALALRADGWYLRSDVVWSKPNPMPESVTDRPTRAHEYVFLLSKSGQPTFWTHRDGPGSRVPPAPDYRWVDAATGDELADEPEGWREALLPDGGRRFRRVNLWAGRDYFYDADAIREDAQDWGTRDRSGPLYDGSVGPQNGHTGLRDLNHAASGRNKRSVWTVATQPYAGAHFATFPPKLIEPCILAGAPERACGECGAPWTRVAKRESDFTDRPGHPTRYGDTATRSAKGYAMPSIAPPRVETLGWEPSCEHGDGSATGVVLDPFAGAGTTGVVALRHGRSFLGIELNTDYAEMGRERIRDDAPLLNTYAEHGA